jgi:hypothetical protein
MTQSKKASLLTILVVTVVALGFALYTNHAWEDYYITFRSSKNLATGHGLVYNHGDRLHTFTSPLGVLLPAVSYLLTFNSSDTGALWIFRLMSCAALGGAAILLGAIAREKNYGKLAALLIIGWLALDAKTIDFTINGMETGFLLLFLAYALWAHLLPGKRQWLHLGAAWAGLMWTRPDSFVYIGVLAAGFWLFNEPERTGLTRGKMAALFVRAGLVTTALYLPWLLFAWGYYGTPVPHTITAKSGIGGPRTLAGLLPVIINLPFKAWGSTGSMEGTFLPAYYIIGGWPEYVVQVARGLAATCSLLWLMPFLRVETRAASFAFFGAHAYLSYYPYFPFPWYLPSTTLLAIFCLGSLLAQLLTVSTQWQSAHPGGDRHRQVLGFATVVALLLLAGTAWTTWQSARLFAAQQKYVEDGNRRKIGEWLRAHAQPGDTVFMEPLGYIGYFSGLKTYDFPGMSSREMVAVRKKIGSIDWILIISHLQPNWLVLRPHERLNLTNENHALMTESYEAVQEFSVADPLEKLDVPGLPYLQHDARFTVFKKRPNSTRYDLARDESPFGFSEKILDGVKVTFAHAPSTLIRQIPPEATRGEVQFGFEEDAYAPAGERTDGATFSVELIDQEMVTILASRTLDPVANPADRGVQQFTFDIPARTARSKLALRVSAGRNMTKDWTCWGTVVFH